MQTAAQSSARNPAIVEHPLTPEDQNAIAALRAIVEPNKGTLEGISARSPFDAIMERVAPAEGVAYRPDVIGGISGWWCLPNEAQPRQAILHLHGGWFNWGSAQAFRHLVGHIARRAGVDAFVPDYRLAPEHPFPAAIDDALASYHGLLERGVNRIALTGDSAGGNLALVLLSLATAQASADRPAPAGAVVLSPVTDLTLSGKSWQTRAAADPYFTLSQARQLARSYIGNRDPSEPLISPLYGTLSGLPPLRVHVGDAEVLLDDSLRYVGRAIDAGVDAAAEVWNGMPHGFLAGVGRLAAADQALEAMGTFLSARLDASQVK
ncbi:alpha/beta hydrolase [Acerihabitans sp. TG2]|uniref:alpha/beta hydrolase n=1 Tax=Acerihabitans sp. TG2 TaxID=3096008 RepID=UPI002B2225FF|nr:alpha/beta hydrolase [Acerihabitans sp. TG2]MEA9389791.1 alpha/beta hydrolase [Acerihabitans sp. TG2]